MRGLLVVNPRATTTSPRVIDVIVHALSDEVDLDVTVTTHKGHGMLLGELALEERLDLVITLGGDGVVNEVVNGMLSRGPGESVPLLATVPGGSGNVFARTLGLPTDAVEATGLILERLRSGSTRTVGLGRAGQRWFVANAGLGIDAEIIAAMETHRRAGRTATPARYLTTTLNQFFRSTNRKDPALTLTRAPDKDGHGGERLEGVFLAIVQNTSPWTYFGTWPMSPCPDASFDAGLDVFVMRRMRVPTALRAASRLLASRVGGPAGGGLIVWHDEAGFTLTASRPVELQIDGEGLGATTEVVFTSHPDALRVVG
ncbi:MAG: diacylglycerol kinase family lipid kinase [Actinobacteria bacterium]|nr:diacylglycerol kinase family lipid kinase [Actinomycetota bacterium]